jgi:hypothetical protein
MLAAADAENKSATLVPNETGVEAGSQERPGRKAVAEEFVSAEHFALT